MFTNQQLPFVGVVNSFLLPNQFRNPWSPRVELRKDIRGRPLMIWGRRKNRKWIYFFRSNAFWNFFSLRKAFWNLFFPGHAPSKKFLDFLRPYPEIINGRPLIISKLHSPHYNRWKTPVLRSRLQSSAVGSSPPQPAPVLRSRAPGRIMSMGALK